MKIAILTWLHNGNFGTVLQAFALQRHLRTEGYDVQNIDLLPTVVQKTWNLIRQGNPPELFLEKWAGYRAKKACPDKASLKRRTERINVFLKENLNLTKRYSRFSDLKKLSCAYDTYICGSDQIWSPTYFSPSYFFDFVKEDKKRISYACSFGVTVMPPKKAERTRKLLDRFYAISVREKTGSSIVRKLLGTDVAVNIDPTMLLSAEEWEPIVRERLISEEYMFCYFLSFNKEYWEKAIKIAKEKRLRVVFVPTTKESYAIDGICVADAGPSEWVSLIKYATIVATDSFHGCVFSIIHRKNFMAFKRFKDTSSSSRNTRVYNLLDTYNIRKCLVEDLDSYRPIEFTQAEYDEVINKVYQNSANSKLWLENAINGE
jgi:hypothetical protein